MNGVITSGTAEHELASFMALYEQCERMFVSISDDGDPEFTFTFAEGEVLVKKRVPIDPSRRDGFVALMDRIATRVDTTSQFTNTEKQA